MTIQLFLLENKSIQAKVNGYPYSYEGGYNIVAGDENATEFEIASVPTQYSNYTISVAMTNARGKVVMPPPIIDNKFILPVGMAVAGYGQIVISMHGTNVDGDIVTAYFVPLKIKVVNTDANWTSGIINGTIAIGNVVTLPPESEAYARNIGTVNDAIIELGIPKGIKGDPGTKGDDGAKGANGDDGRGVSHIFIAYAIGDDGVTVPSATWSTVIPEVPQGKWLWVAESISYTDNTPSTMFYWATYQGKDGTQITVDDQLSNISENPVQNKVVTNAILDKVSKSGDTMTGGLGLENLFSNSPQNNGFVVPFNMSLDPTTPSGDLLQSAAQILKRIKSAFPTGRNDKTFFGRASNSWIGTYMANVYMNESDPTQELPQYSSGILITRGTQRLQIWLIGTENYVLGCQPVATLSDVDNKIAAAITTALNTPV